MATRAARSFGNIESVAVPCIAMPCSDGCQCMLAVGCKATSALRRVTSGRFDSETFDRPETSPVRAPAAAACQPSDLSHSPYDIRVLAQTSACERFRTLDSQLSDGIPASALGELEVTRLSVAATSRRTSRQGRSLGSRSSPQQDGGGMALLSEDVEGVSIGPQLTLPGDCPVQRPSRSSSA